MRAVSIAFALCVVSAAQTRTSDAPISGRPPAVFWKRSMKGTPATTPPEAPAVSAKPASVVPPPAPAAPRLSRDVLLHGLAELKAGSTRAHMIRKLGTPSYSIGIPEGEHYVERCRFRAGSDSIASIELRDGRVTAILVE